MTSPDQRSRNSRYARAPSRERGCVTDGSVFASRAASMGITNKLFRAREPCPTASIEQSRARVRSSTTSRANASEVPQNNRMRGASASSRDKLKDRALLPGPFLFGRWRYRRARDLRVSGTLIRLRRLYRDAIPGSIIRLEAGSPTAGYHPREILLSTLANVASVVALFLGTAVGVSAVYFARS